MRLIAINAARYDAHKHRALSVVGDALAGIEELGQALEAGRPRPMDFQSGPYMPNGTPRWNSIRVQQLMFPELCSCDWRRQPCL